MFNLQHLFTRLICCVLSGFLVFTSMPMAPAHAATDPASYYPPGTTSSTPTTSSTATPTSSPSPTSNYMNNYPSGDLASPLSLASSTPSAISKSSGSTASVSTTTSATATTSNNPTPSTTTYSSANGVDGTRSYVPPTTQPTANSTAQYAAYMAQQAANTAAQAAYAASSSSMSAVIIVIPGGPKITVAGNQATVVVGGKTMSGTFEPTTQMITVHAITTQSGVQESARIQLGGLAPQTYATWMEVITRKTDGTTTVNFTFENGVIISERVISVVNSGANSNTVDTLTTNEYTLTNGRQLVKSITRNSATTLNFGGQIHRSTEASKESFAYDSQGRQTGRYFVYDWAGFDRVEHHEASYHFSNYSEGTITNVSTQNLSTSLMSESILRVIAKINESAKSKEVEFYSNRDLMSGLLRTVQFVKNAQGNFVGRLETAADNTTFIIDSAGKRIQFNQGQEVGGHTVNFGFAANGDYGFVFRAADDSSELTVDYPAYTTVEINGKSRHVAISSVSGVIWLEDPIYSMSLEDLRASLLSQLDQKIAENDAAVSAANQALFEMESFVAALRHDLFEKSEEFHAMANGDISLLQFILDNRWLMRPRMEIEDEGALREVLAVIKEESDAMPKQINDYINFMTVKKVGLIQDEINRRSDFARQLQSSRDEVIKAVDVYGLRPLKYSAPTLPREEPGEYLEQVPDPREAMVTLKSMAVEVFSRLMNSDIVYLVGLYYEQQQSDPMTIGVRGFVNAGANNSGENYTGTASVAESSGYGEGGCGAGSVALACYILDLLALRNLQKELAFLQEIEEEISIDVEDLTLKAELTLMQLEGAQAAYLEVVEEIQGMEDLMQRFPRLQSDDIFMESLANLKDDMDARGVDICYAIDNYEYDQKQVTIAEDELLVMQDKIQTLELRIQALINKMRAAR